MKRATWILLAGSLALAACSGSGEPTSEPVPENPESTSDDNNTTSEETTQASACDGKGQCDACQQCAYAEGGSCEATVGTCLANQACVALAECMTGCVGNDPTAFSGCMDQCSADHAQGEDDYVQVLGCVGDACATDCRF